jgi:transcriptional regulator with XRE-family HTH domain
MKKLELEGVVFYGDLADVATSIAPEEWEYYDLLDSVSEQIRAHMEAAGVHKAELAARLGTSRAFVTKALAGDSNMTLKTLSKILNRLDAKPEIKIIGKNDVIRWMGIVGRQQKPKPVSRDWTKEGFSQPVQSPQANCVQSAA